MLNPALCEDRVRPANTPETNCPQAKSRTNNLKAVVGSDVLCHSCLRNRLYRRVSGCNTSGQRGPTGFLSRRRSTDGVVTVLPRSELFGVDLGRRDGIGN